MKRVTRHACDDAPIPEEQETEGQRQLHSLLLQQLDTDVDIDRCVAKRKCFAPAALYKPFGEQAAGVRSLSQFQALQDGEQELASLRELGLTDSEVELWRTRDVSEAAGKGRGVCVAPGARHERLQVIRDKIEARAQLLSRPQRFSASRPLSRREMEIERALFHGNDRLGFLTALYHQEEESPANQQGAPSSNPMDTLYKDFLKEGRKGTYFPADTKATTLECSFLPQPKPQNKPDQSKSPYNTPDQSQTQSDHESTPLVDTNKCLDQSAKPQDTTDQSQSQSLAVPRRMNVSQPIRTLCAVSGPGPKGLVTVSGRIEQISEEEIRENRETEEGIRCVPRFQNYQRGEPSNVLCVKNLSPWASLAQLVSLFSRFQQDDGQPILYRLLTGRLKGQAFITFSDIETAHTALELVNGYRLLDKPLVIEFGRERRDAEKGQRSETSTAVPNTPSTQAVKEIHNEEAAH